MKVDEIQQILNENNFLDAELIQDNKVHFHYEGKVYRVRMPNQKEMSEVNRLKHAFNMELLKTPNLLNKDNLKKLLKESQGIDIDEMEKELEELEEQLYKVYLEMVPKRDDDKEGIDNCIKQKEEINNKRYKIIEQISRHLTPSIDVQVEDFYMEQLTAICTDVAVELENGEIKFEREWKSFEDFYKDERKLRIYAVSLLTKLIMQVNL